ncbi:phage tail tape measure protein [Parasedimentitalea huanghaiensis]|uniref:phage tail tape measure protein n=1 Tax=Parasedimentitalea huanghaiensis TaxID=2682100 RepID=UPI001ADC845D
MLDLLKFDITAQSRTAAAFDRTRNDLRGVKGALAGVNDYARRTGRTMRNLGAGLSAAMTAPLAYLGKQSVQLYDQQVDAERTVAQAIRSTGGAARLSAQDLKGMAAALQGVTTFGDEDILRNVTAPLLTFTKVQGDVFRRAQTNVLDMATLLKMDLKSASILVGKALNDPIKGISALGRSGVQFSEDQKKVIKSLVETGDVAAAQALILRELETQFQGQAASAAQSPLGQWRQLSNAISDVKEELGKEIVPFMEPLKEQIKDGVRWFSALSPEVKKNIVVAGGLATAFGPAITSIGLLVLSLPVAITALGGMAKGMGLIITLAPRMAAAIALAAGPWGMLAALVGGTAAYFLVFRDNAEKVKEPLEQIKEAQAALNAALGVFESTAAPRAGAAAVDAANDYYDMAKAARDAASSNVALLQSELAMQEGINSGLKFGNFFGEDEAGLIQEDLVCARSELAEATRALEIAESRRKDTATRVMRSDTAMVKTAEALNSTLQVTVDGVDALGVASSNATGKVDGLGAGLETAEEKARRLEQSAKRIEDDFGSTFSSIVRGSEDAGAALGRLTDRLLDQMLSDAFSGVFGQLGLGNIFSGLTGGGGVIMNAKGNAFQGGRVSAFAKGGVVSAPTYFPLRGGTGLMGEAGPEAILPLSRGSGGKLGVHAQVSGGSAPAQEINLQVVVHSASGSENVQAEQTGSDRIDVFIDNSLKRSLESGKQDKVLSRRFGLRPKAMGY